MDRPTGESFPETTCPKVNDHSKLSNVKSLVISRKEERKRRRWTFSSQLCDPKATIVRSNLKFANLKASYLLNLKELKILNATDNRKSERRDRIPLLTDLKFINRLEKLEVLEISKIDFETEATLALPNLWWLEVKQLHSKLKLSTPKLCCFKSASLENVEFEFKEILAYLFLDTYSSKAKQFKNLIYLAFQCNPTKNEKQNEHLLLDHPKLRKLSIRPDYASLDAAAYETARKRAMQFLRQKRDLDRSDLILAFFGVQIKFPFQLTGYEYQEDLIEFQLQNYVMVDPQEVAWCIESVNYTSLMQAIEGGIIDDLPKDFHEHFGQVSEVLVTGPFEEEHLLDFLKRFEHLASFRIRNNELIETQFFEKLAADCPSIGSLSLENHEKDAEELVQDFEFIFQFDNLYRLHSDSRISLSLIERLFDKHGAFELSTYMNGHAIIVKREERKSPFDLFVDAKFHSDHFDLGSLMEKLRNKFGDQL